MLYLDYSATTPVDNSVLDTFMEVNKRYWANPNSLHTLGRDVHELMNEASKQVASLLHVKPREVIFTSSASEANNMAIKGICYKYQNRSKHIVTTELEHSSVSETVKFLEEDGYSVHYVKLTEEGLIDLEDLKYLLTTFKPSIVSICLVNSEVGILQDIVSIKKIVKEYPLTFLHIDATQAIGKVPVDLDGIDLCSFSAHKIYGLKGVACLIKKEKIALTPLIHGGDSQTIYRASTPAVALMVSMAKALKLSLLDLDKKYNHVLKLKEKLMTYFKKCDLVTINSSNNCIPHIINISLKNIKSETFLHALELREVYISTKTACSSRTAESSTLKALGKNKEIATRSLRISLSYKTSEEDIEKFIQIFDTCLKELNFMKGE